MTGERSFIEQALLDLNTAAYFDDSRKQDEVERRIAEHVGEQDAEIARLNAEVARLSAARTQDAARYVASTPDRVFSIDHLADDIRRLDGSHALGAASLAERLIDAGWVHL